MRSAVNIRLEETKEKMSDLNVIMESTPDGVALSGEELGIFTKALNESAVMEDIAKILEFALKTLDKKAAAECLNSYHPICDYGDKLLHLVTPEWEGQGCRLCPLYKEGNCYSERAVEYRNVKEELEHEWGSKS